jgi:DNA-binding LytR/AlgR family response regulator
MEKLNCIIVEDEPLAAEVLQDYIQQVPFLELVTVCTNVMTAMEALKKTKIDLIFLDIHLPKIKGIDFIKTLKDPPWVIITSAYQEYAINGYELDVLDYLVKPIELNRFLKAVNKIPAGGHNIAKQKAVAGTGGEYPNEKPHLFFNVSKKKVKVFVEDILYVESLKEYIKIVTATKTIVTKLQLAELEKLLPTGFLRVHRSFIVSRSKIDAFTATEIEIGKTQIPIGRSYKELVFHTLASAN